MPPEYRRLGCLPADQFIPALMEHRNVRYYVGLLSAAQFHGAAHHRPQEFQVVVERNRLAILCGAVRVVFVARRLLEYVGVGDRAVLLKEHVRRRARNYAKLLRGAEASDALRSEDWRLFVNASIETDT